MNFEKWMEKGAIDIGEVGEIFWPLIKPLIRKAYYGGYSDAVDIYQECIDKKGLREQWDKPHEH